MAESGLIVRVPEAEALVGLLRERFHPVARLGVPAHVTVLFPFVAPELVDGAVLGRLRGALAGVSPFAFELARVGRFPETAYLAPDPAEPFADLTRRLAGAFPAFPPFGGAHDDIVPHLTVSHGDAASAALAATELVGLLDAAGPIRAMCREVELLENSTGMWRPMAMLVLGREGQGGEGG